MIPDRSNDSIHTEVGPGADEISLCNVIRLEKHGRLWRALVGPDYATGLQAFGETQGRAVLHLMVHCESMGWVWDETWREPNLP
jgi:hypothetical protein